MTSPIRHAEWSTSGLIASIQRNGLLPSNQSTFQTADWIAMLNEEAQSTVVPLIIGLDANYFLATTQVSIVQSQSRALTGAGTSQTFGGNVGYQLPPDAVGKRLHDVSVITSSGTMVNVPLMTAWRAGAPTYNRFGAFIAGDATGAGDTLYLFPASQFTNLQSIQLIYPQAVLALCDDTGAPTALNAAGQLVPINAPTAVPLTGVNVTTGVLTFAAVPATWAIGTPINFVSGNPQFSTRGVAAITALTATTVTVDPTTLANAYYPQTVFPGDWVADAGYSPFLQLPAEGRNLVTQSVIVKALQALKDDGWQTAKTKYDEMASAASFIFSPRIDDSPKILSSSGRGIGSYQRFGNWLRS